MLNPMREGIGVSVPSTFPGQAVRSFLFLVLVLLVDVIAKPLFYLVYPYLRVASASTVAK